MSKVHHLNKYSSKITQTLHQGASQAMLYAIGFKKNDMKKAQIGVSSVWYEGNPCNNHLNFVSKKICESINSHINNNMKALRFNTVGISDGISMGTKGMRYSLPSRELITDSIESVMNAQHYDANISVPGCDKNLPGCLIGMLRVNRPGLIVYGGSTTPGYNKNEKIDIVDAFQSFGKLKSCEINMEERENIIKHACPQSGSCGGMYTANTMAVAFESMGISMLNDSSHPALSNFKIYECMEAGNLIHNLLLNDIKPKDIITKKSLINGLKMGIALGGSTNLILHILAIAQAADIDLHISEINEIGKDVPVIGNMKPFGKYLMNDLHRIGGTCIALKYLLEENIIDGSILTITTNTLEENLSKISTKNLRENKYNIQDILRINNPIKNSSHLKIFNGNIAPEGAVGKITGFEGEYFKGRALVFNSEDGFMNYITNDSNKKYLQNTNDKLVIIIRYVGPKGGPGMPEMLNPTAAIIGLGIEKNVAFLTDGRFSGGSHGFIIGHICPEAYVGGPIAFIKNNDIIEIDSSNLTINVINLSNKELNIRKNEFLKYTDNKKISGYLNKYRKLVTPASIGCFID